MTPDEMIAQITNVAAGPVETCFVIGHVERMDGNMTYLYLSKGKEVRQFGLITEQVKRDLLSKDSALFEIPAAYIQIFDLSAFTLDEKEIIKQKKRARDHGLSFLKITKEVKPEFIGNIRIN